MNALTEQERELLRALACGLTIKEIAQSMRLCYSTVRRLSSTMYRRMGAENAAHACYLWGQTK